MRNCGALGREISTQRRKIIPKLKKAVMNQLADLGFQQSNFDITIQTLAQEQFVALSAHCPSSGLDSIEFQFSPNVGEPARPLRAIASSGEMARVMLALKTVLAAEDEIPLLIFDEVDANIGGETAHAVGEKMRQIGQQRQVLCITHLAPVAAAAANHFIVTKQVKTGRTISEIHLLDLVGRVEELARMLGDKEMLLESMQRPCWGLRAADRIHASARASPRFGVPPLGGRVCDKAAGLGDFDAC